MSTSRFPSLLLTGGGCLVLLLWLYSETTTWLISPVLLLALVAIPAAGAAFLLTEPASRWRRHSGLILVLALTIIPGSIPLHEWLNAITRQRASTLIQAAGKFQHAEGRYPDSLQQLVPRYLAQVPATAFGLVAKPPFYYTAFSDTTETGYAFTLSYNLGLMVDATYNSQDGQWQLDD